MNNAERFIIHRRRKFWTQADAAEHYDVRRETIIRWEAGTTPAPDVELDGRTITQAEHAFLTRRRNGLTVQAVADRLGISRVTYRRIEAGQRDAKEVLALFG